MFISPTLARRIERAEAQLARALTEAVIESGRAPQAFVRPLGAGVASHVRPGSPLNKLIGVGLDAPVDEVALAGIERAFWARGEPARVELSTLATTESSAVFAARGYRLVGFENVLVLPLPTAKAARSPSAQVERVTPATRPIWRETTLSAAAAPDETGVVVDSLSHDLLAKAIDDTLLAPGFERYLALLDGMVVGAASMLLRDGVAIFSGSATLPAARRRGVQATLIATRLEHAAARGAELAMITTAPGSQSQANVMKHGFMLAYARAILVRESGDPSPTAPYVSA